MLSSKKNWSPEWRECVNAFYVGLGMAIASLLASLFIFRLMLFPTSFDAAFPYFILIVSCYFFWQSGYKYGTARGWADIAVRKLPKEERVSLGVFLSDDECIFKSSDTEITEFNK